MFATLLLAAVLAPSTIHVYDARPLQKADLHKPEEARRVWDTMHLLSALQGLANRESPRFYLLYCSEFGVDTDSFWLDWARREDGWLKDTRVKELRRIEDALSVFRRSYKGLVVYDPAVPATSNLASTAAGCERLLPIRFDSARGSLFNLLTKRLKLPVSLWLVEQDGSPKFTGKVDAYKWALARWVRTGQADAHFAAYYIDAFWLNRPYAARPDMHTLSNHDYFVSHKAFFFDLSPWADEQPNDDPAQPLGADRREFLEIMRALYDGAGGRMIKVGGFPPWPFKYTNTRGLPGKHGGVPTEWEFSRLISQYDGYMEADAAGLGAIANASFFQHYPLAARYDQPNRKPTAKDWQAAGYLDSTGKVAKAVFLSFYVGDYDAPSWLYKAVPAFFSDPARGQVPLAWAFNPNLADRAPQALVYAYRHASANDFFISGDSGAGYLNARALSPSGLDAWAEHCRTYFQHWGMSITGFLLDGSAGASTDREFAAYRAFSPDGIGTHFEKGPAIHMGVATCPEIDLPNNVDEAAAKIARLVASGNRPVFLWTRSILRTPAWYADLSKRLKAGSTEIKIVDPYTFFGLIERVVRMK